MKLNLSLLQSKTLSGSVALTDKRNFLSSSLRVLVYLNLITRSLLQETAGSRQPDIAQRRRVAVHLAEAEDPGADGGRPDRRRRARGHVEALLRRTRQEPLGRDRPAVVELRLGPGPAHFFEFGGLFKVLS